MRWLSLLLVGVSSCFVEVPDKWEGEFACHIDEDCAEDFKCINQRCIDPKNTTLECGVCEFPHHCINGDCIINPAACSDENPGGFCENVGDVCVEGNCEPEQQDCIPPCDFPYHCVEGSCDIDPNTCQPGNPAGDCPGGMVCDNPGGFCIDIDTCDPRGDGSECAGTSPRCINHTHCLEGTEMCDVPSLCGNGSACVASGSCSACQNRTFFDGAGTAITECVYPCDDQSDCLAREFCVREPLVNENVCRKTCDDGCEAFEGCVFLRSVDDMWHHVCGPHGDWDGAFGGDEPAWVATNGGCAAYGAGCMLANHELEMLVLDGTPDAGELRYPVTVVDVAGEMIAVRSDDTSIANRSTLHLARTAGGGHCLKEALLTNGAYPNQLRGPVLSESPEPVMVMSCESSSAGNQCFFFATPTASNAEYLMSWTWSAARQCTDVEHGPQSLTAVQNIRSLAVSNERVAVSVVYSGTTVEDRILLGGPSTLNVNLVPNPPDTATARGNPVLQGPVLSWLDGSNLNPFAEIWHTEDDGTNVTELADVGSGMFCELQAGNRRLLALHGANCGVTSWQSVYVNLFSEPHASTSDWPAFNIPSTTPGQRTRLSGSVVAWAEVFTDIKAFDLTATNMGVNQYATIVDRTLDGECNDGVALFAWDIYSRERGKLTVAYAIECVHSTGTQYQVFARELF